MTWRFTPLLFLTLYATAAEPPLPKGAVVRYGTPSESQSRDLRYALSPDGNHFVSQSALGITITSVHGSEPPKVLFAQVSSQEYVCFGADGSVLRCTNKSLTRHDRTSGAILSIFPNPHPEHVFAIHPEGTWAAVFTRRGNADSPDGPSGELLLYNLKDPKAEPKSLLQSDVSEVVMSKAENLLAVRSRQEISIWDLNTAKKKHSFYGDREHKSTTNCVALSADGTMLLGCFNSGNYIWKLGKDPRWRLDIGGSNIICAAFLTDGKHAICVDGDCNVHKVDTATGEFVITHAGASPFFVDTLSADGRRFSLTRNTNSTRGILDTITGAEIKTSSFIPPLYSARTTAKNTIISVAAGDFVVEWDPATGKQLRKLEFKLPAKPDGVNSEKARFLTPLGTYLVVPVKGGEKKFFADVYETTTGKKISQFGPVPAFPAAINFSPDEREAYMESEAVVSVWDVLTGKLIYRPDETWDSAFPSPDGRHVFFNDNCKFAYFERATRKARKTNDMMLLKKDENFFAASYTRDGRTMALFGETFILVFDIDTLLVKHSFSEPGRGRNGTKTGVISPDGRWLIHPAITTPNVTEQIEVRDLSPEGNPAPFRIKGHVGEVSDFTFTNDGKYLVSVGKDGLGHVWDMAQFPKLKEAPKNEVAQLPVPSDIWKQLGNTDPSVSDGAIVILTANHAAALALAKEKLLPPIAVPATAITKWLEELDSEVFSTREAATNGLGACLDQAEAAIKKELSKEEISREKRGRLEKLLAKLDDYETDPEHLVALRMLEVLERIGSKEAMAEVTRLASGASGARITRDAKSSLKRMGK